MYNSQITVAQAAKIWNCLVLVLLLTIGLSYANEVNGKQNIKNNTTQQITKPPTVETVSTNQIVDQIVDQGYRKAKFLAIVKTNDSVDYTQRDLMCLAKNIYHEAGAEPTKGKFAVAQVTINRTKNPYFEGTICQVVMAHKQFSWTLNQRLRNMHPSGEMWDESVRVATAALKDGVRVKGMENTLYYHANYVHPRWNNVVRLAQIGAHIFYDQV